MKQAPRQKPSTDIPNAIQMQSTDITSFGILDMAQRVMGNRELAEKWLSQPAIALDGRIPQDVLTTVCGRNSVAELLTRMELGVYL